MLGQIALVCGLPLAVVSGAIQPLIEVVLGSEWRPTADIVIFGSLAMLLGASIASPINSYCLAEGKPNPPVLAIGVELLVGFALAAALIGVLDETGIGIAMSVGAAIAAAILLRAVEPEVRAGAVTVAKVVAITALATVAGQLLPVSNDGVGLLIALCASGLAWLALAAVIARSEMGRMLGMVRSVLPGFAR